MPVHRYSGQFKSTLYDGKNVPFASFGTIETILHPRDAQPTHPYETSAKLTYEGFFNKKNSVTFRLKVKPTPDPSKTTAESIDFKLGEVQVVNTIVIGRGTLHFYVDKWVKNAIEGRYKLDPIDISCKGDRGVFNLSMVKEEKLEDIQAPVKSSTCSIM